MKINFKFLIVSLGLFIINNNANCTNIIDNNYLKNDCQNKIINIQDTDENLKKMQNILNMVNRDKTTTEFLPGKLYNNFHWEKTPYNLQFFNTYNNQFDFIRSFSNFNENAPLFTGSQIIGCTLLTKATRIYVNYLAEHLNHSNYYEARSYRNIGHPKLFQVLESINLISNDENGLFYIHQYSEPIDHSNHFHSFSKSEININININHKHLDKFLCALQLLMKNPLPESKQVKYIPTSNRGKCLINNEEYNSFLTEILQSFVISFLLMCQDSFTSYENIYKVVNKLLQTDSEVNKFNEKNFTEVFGENCINNLKNVLFKLTENIINNDSNLKKPIRDYLQKYLFSPDLVMYNNMAFTALSDKDFNKFTAMFLGTDKEKATISVPENLKDLLNIFPNIFLEIKGVSSDKRYNDRSTLFYGKFFKNNIDNIIEYFKDLTFTILYPHIINYISKNLLKDLQIFRERARALIHMLVGRNRNEKECEKDKNGRITYKIVKSKYTEDNIVSFIDPDSEILSLLTQKVRDFKTKSCNNDILNISNNDVKSNSEIKTHPNISNDKQNNSKVNIFEINKDKNKHTQIHDKKDNTPKSDSKLMLGKKVKKMNNFSNNDDTEQYTSNKKKKLE